MRTTKIVLLVILCGLIVFLCGILGMGLSNDGGSFFSKDGAIVSQNYDLVLEKEVEADGITSLLVQYDMNSNDVFFYENTGDTILIREYFNFTPRENQLSTVQQNGGELLIKGRSRNFTSFLSFGNSQNGYTEIYLPAGFYADLSVKTVSGDIRSEIPFAQSDSFAASSVSGDIFFPLVEAGNIDMSSTSGDIFTGQVTCKRLQASTVSGDITLENVEGNTDISSTSGDICVRGGNGSRNISSISGEIRLFLEELTDSLEISTTSGDVFIQLPEEAAFALKFSSTSGDCNTFFNDVLSFNKRGTTANGQYGGNSDIKVTVSTTSGSLRITAN